MGLERFATVRHHLVKQCRMFLTAQALGRMPIGSKCRMSNAAQILRRPANCD